MKSKKIINKAFSSLSKKEQELFNLLNSSDLTKENVLIFLNDYDIESESASISFLINELIDRFDINEADSPLIPRIKGLKEYFHFNNATALMNRKDEEVILDLNLYLKIQHPEVTRPFSVKTTFLTKEYLEFFFGKKYIKKLIDNSIKVKFQNKEFSIPEEKHLNDIIFIGLFLAATYQMNESNTLSYLLDVNRYCKDLKISGTLSRKITFKNIRHKLGGIKRWNSKQKN